MSGVPIVWTNEMTAALLKLRRGGTSLYECSEIIGVCYQVAVFKARELGVAARMNKGRMPGQAMARERETA